MLIAPDIDPVALQLGPLKIHWYGLMYLVGFLGGWAAGVYRAKQPNSGWQHNEVGDLLFYIAIGVVLGGRLGYVLFYNFGYYLKHPLEIVFIWTGGMSFHGGLIGVIAALWLYARKTKRHWLAVTDFIAPLAPIGLGAGRIGNFINHELWGRVTDVPWGMVFRNAGAAPRHPTQLYEFALEGVVLFLVLWFYSRVPRPVGAVSGLFLIGYGVFRFAVEFVRVPDAHLGYLALDWVTMGQILSLPMILVGVAMLVWAYRRRPAPPI
ncbi:MAG: prolipoprotein diacylglyceryl transferase [Gammaproteobacteria bacterium]